MDEIINSKKSSIDPLEVAKFAKLKAYWWDKEGPLKTLHDINPARMAFIKKHASLKGMDVLDLGCGGGILAEAMAKAGAEVMAIDAEGEAIAVAKEHAQKSHLKINYQHQCIEELASGPFDLLTCMELLEHVKEPEGIIQHCATLLKPGGLLLASTINRTWQAYLGAIVAAEYLLRLLPQQTHDYSKFIRPSELAEMGIAAGLEMLDLAGISYNPLNREAKIHQSVAVNYCMAFKKPL